MFKQSFNSQVKSILQNNRSLVTILLSSIWTTLIAIKNQKKKLHKFFVASGLQFV